MNRKGLIFLIVGFLYLFVQVDADTIQIKDIDSSSSFARDSIIELAMQNVIQGDENGKFNPKKQITRVEMVTLLVKALNLDTSLVPETATFVDVPKNNWASKYVEAAYKAGIINGADANKFEPNKISTREQMAVMFIRALKLLDSNYFIEFKNIGKLTDKEKISSWAKNEVEITMGTGLMNGVSAAKFDPLSYATKEQTAVVIDRFLKNKDTIITQYNEQYNTTRFINLVFNDEIILLKNKPVIENNVVWVPMEFTNRFVLEHSNNEYVQNANTNTDDIRLNIDTVYSDKGISNLWFKAGYKNAYKNLEMYPFIKESDYKDNLLALDAAPVVKNGLTYLPLKDLCRIIGIDYSYDANNHTVTLKDPRIGQQPNLYYALKKLSYYKYTGEISAQASFEEINQTTNTYSKVSYDQLDRMNDPFNGYFSTKYTYQESNKEPETLKSEEIIANTKAYVKDFSDNKWIVSDIELKDHFIAVDFYDPLYEDSVVIHRYINRDIYNNLSRLEVRRDGIVNVNGKSAVKYSVELDSATIQNIMPEDEYLAVKDYIRDVFNNSIKYTYEFYVSDGTVIKQVYQFNGLAADTDTNNAIGIKVNTDVNYNKIGQKFQIPVPDNSQIKKSLQ